MNRLNALLKFCLLNFLTIIFSFSVLHAKNTPIQFSYYDYIPELQPFRGTGIRSIEITNPAQYKALFQHHAPPNFNWDKNFIITLYTGVEADEESDCRIHVYSIQKTTNTKGYDIYKFIYNINKIYRPPAGYGIGSILPKSKIAQVTLKINSHFSSRSKIIFTQRKRHQN